MAAPTDTSQLQDLLSKYQSNNLASIIAKLAGDKDNLHIDIQQVKFFVGKQNFEINGKVSFNVLRKNQTPKLKEISNKR
jgi:hypothetical protein